MKETKDPYPECSWCETLEDCPCPDIENSFLCEPLPPNCCPFPLEVMKRTMEKHKLYNCSSGN